MQRQRHRGDVSQFWTRKRQISKFEESDLLYVPYNSPNASLKLLRADTKNKGEEEWALFVDQSTAEDCHRGKQRHIVNYQYWQSFNSSTQRQAKAAIPS